MFWFKKKPATKKLKPQRVTVHCAGLSVTHYAVYQTHRAYGGLTLHNELDSKAVVAEYAPGVWMSLSHGTRKVSK